ncbi:1-acyl-sn-glycerol-3-phosphate acyltransferase [Tychonema sp. LEGE 07199]|uniref:1-acyl-sn-glycerol-3-phosphate acyltransferase n=1 Tax=unclassified Tychonema TaxID=2642144 RepID=UPI00187FA0BF|nr:MULTISPECIES: 1-acyl-sn-glycerol-3-phosphate acyltransferase [unclassified Tychonema]MBE9121987.1 1-acyl-sn-glycerol-3-phosphate acyltransferase [Tychonema sp. LEGE 07199]MBE9132103.1 1-acyl-sn-glycerol-3-phosphate acyltransferase [Tychonema sp. LEGE 07196]
MANSIHQVQPPLEFIPPAYNPLIVRGTQQILPYWLRFRTNISHIQAENVETLAELFHQFQNQKVRFLLAFRHPNSDDPYCLGQLIWKLVPQTARAKGIPLQFPVHSHFIYDRGIPLWAGAGVGWLYSRLGGTPIVRGKIDRAGLRSARDLFANSQFPIAAAPEGATNGHNEIVSPLEPGIAQMGFWCVEDLLKAGRTEEKVLIVPIGIQYRYVNPPWEPLEKLLTQLEIDCGLPPLDRTNTTNLEAENSDPEDQNYKFQYLRLIRLGSHLLTVMSEFYSRFYHKKIQPTTSILTSLSLPDTTANDSGNEVMVARLTALLDVALQVAEEYFNLKPKGSLIDRCRRLEQAGWDYIYREDIKDIAALCPLERGLADRLAEEASLRMWHMRLVESFVSVTGRYVQEKLTAERLAETTLLLWDVLTRIKGGNPFGRPSLGKQQVKMTVGEPLSVGDRWQGYQTSRRLAVAELTQDLQSALEAMIKS